MSITSFVIPLYNDEKNFNEFFDYNYKLIKKNNSGNEIILVDDTKNESFIFSVLKKYSDVKIIHHEVNKGFSISINDGVYAASNEIVFLLNSDIKLTVEAIEKSVLHFNSSNIFAVTFKSEFENGKIREGAKQLTWKTGLPFILHAERDFPKKDSEGKIPSFYPVGGHCAVRKSMFQKLNGMDYITFHPFYWEDTDLGCNAIKMGWKTIYEPEAIVYHPPENSSIKDNFKSNTIRKIKFRNRVFFALKNYDSLYRRIFLRIGLFLRFIEKFFSTKSINKSYKETLGLIKEYKGLHKRK